VIEIVSRFDTNIIIAYWSSASLGDP